MGRLIKSRKVKFLPHTRRFIPYNGETADMDIEGEGEIYLKLEELESMRLRDIEALTQQECADRMGISRQTFQNIVANAREKLTRALIEGKPINIRGGNYKFDFCKLRCKSCQSIYEIEHVRDKTICPSCKSQEIICKKRTEKCTNWCGKLLK